MTEEKELMATVEIRIPFQDADPAGVAWHGNYFRYFDTARCALLDRINYSYRQMAESGFMWPIVDTRVKYIRAVEYDHVIHVRAKLVEWEYRLKIEYEVHDAAGRCVTKGYTIQVAVDKTTGELCIGSPAALTDKLQHFFGGTGSSG
jgi:acyl-CoA thioester hydrolase